MTIQDFWYVGVLGYKYQVMAKSVKTGKLVVKMTGLRLKEAMEQLVTLAKCDQYYGAEIVLLSTRSNQPLRTLYKVER